MENVFNFQPCGLLSLAHSWSSISHTLRTYTRNLGYEYSIFQTLFAHSILHTYTMCTLYPSHVHNVHPLSFSRALCAHSILPTYTLCTHTLSCIRTLFTHYILHTYTLCTLYPSHVHSLHTLSFTSTLYAPPTTLLHTCTVSATLLHTCTVSTTLLHTCSVSTTTLPHTYPVSTTLLHTFPVSTALLHACTVSTTTLLHTRFHPWFKHAHFLEPMKLRSLLRNSLGSPPP